MATNIVYLHPPRNQDSNFFAQIPVGLFGIVNNLVSNGYDVTGFNVPMEKSIDPSFTVEDALLNIDPDIVLIDLHWYEHSYGAVNLAREVKRYVPNCSIIIGGLTASIYASHIVQAYPEVDFIIKGEAEQPTLELVNQLTAESKDWDNISGLTYFDGDSVVENPITFNREFDARDPFDYVNYQWLHNKHVYLHTTPAGITNKLKSFWLLIGAGCRYNCSYCGGSRSAQRRVLMRKSVSLRTAQNVTNDIVSLHKLGVEVINPSLDISIFGNKYWNELFSLIKQAGIEIGMYLELFQNPSEEFLRGFAETFDLTKSHLVFSPLSDNEKIRKTNGKYYDTADFITSLDICAKLKIPVEVCLSKNIPGQDENLLYGKAMFVKEIKQTYPGTPIIDHDIVLDPMSNMAVKPDRFNIKCSFVSFDDYYNYCSGKIENPDRTGYTCCVA